MPRNPSTLNETTDANGWWEKHRPLLLQTAPLGLVEFNQRLDRNRAQKNGVVDPPTSDERPNPTFQGWRLLHVVNGTISRVALMPA